MSRGGRRAGKPGGNYAQRTDLRKPATKALGPSQTYGENAGLTRAMQQVPIGNPDTATPMSAPVGVPAGPQGPPPNLAQVAGQMPDLFAPSDRPDEHLLTGVGQPAFSPPPPLLQAVAALNTVPASTPELRQLRAQLSAAQTNQAAP